MLVVLVVDVVCTFFSYSIQMVIFEGFYKSFLVLGLHFYIFFNAVAFTPVRFEEI